MREYSWLNTVFFVNGTELGGYDEGDDVIRLERLEDSASHVIGVDGEMTVSFSADRSGEIVFRLMQTSDFNQFLSNLVSSAENGAFVPIFAQFKDTRGGDLGSGTQGYIPRPGAMVRGKNANPVEWRIVVERLDLLHNGG